MLFVNLLKNVPTDYHVMAFTSNHHLLINAITRLNHFHWKLQHLSKVPLKWRYKKVYFKAVVLKLWYASSFPAIFEKLC